MSLSARIVTSLLAGLCVGILIARLAPGAGDSVLPILQTIGAGWIRGLQMTIVPLVFALLVTGVASAADSAQAGGVAARALAYFAVGLSLSALVSGLLVISILSLWPIPPAARDLLGAVTTAVPAGSATISGEWFLSLIPTNPIKAAAEGAMVPLVLFALMFGFAITRISSDGRAGLVGLFQGIVDTLLVMVHWVLWLAPIGVFALATVAGARAGLAAAGTLIQYIVIVASACTVVSLLVYPAVALAGRIGLRHFARAVLPAQAIAFSTQSSIASLPAMIEATSGPLEVPDGVRNMALPMAVSVFRVTSAAANFAVALYVAALHGIHVGPGVFIVGMIVAVVVSLAAVGLPSQVSFFTTIGPVCLAMGVPIEVLPLLLAVETIPDIFRTVGNVTADIAVTRIVAARSGALG